MEIELPLVNTEASDDDVINKNQVLKWVASLYQHIEKSSVEIMKLGFRAELTQAKLDPKETMAASDLYHLLAQKYCNPEVCLSRFIYALEKLGHRRHGHRAVRNLHNFNIEKPKPFVPAENIDSTKLRQFNFYQCLVEICSHLDDSHCKRLITLATKTFLDGANRRTIETPCQLFIDLLGHKKLSEDDQGRLVEILDIIGAEKCIDYIHNYRYSNNLPEIGGNKYEDGTMRSNSSSITDESSREPTLIRRPGHKKRQRYAHVQPSHDSGPIMNTAEFAGSGAMDMSSIDTASRNNYTDQDQLLHEAQPGGMTIMATQNKFTTSMITQHKSTDLMISVKKSRWKLCCIPSALLSAILLGVLATIMLGIIIASHIMNTTSTTLYRDNATVILTELHNFFTGSVIVTQDTAYPGDTDHEIDVYIVDSKCNDLPILEVTDAHIGRDLSVINKTTLYLLAGSSITYSVCELTSHTNKTGRLEVVILDNLKSTESPENIHNSFHKFSYFNMHKRDEPSCDVINHSFEANGYYTVVFLSPPYAAQFEYNVTYHKKLIDLIQLSVVTNHTLYTDKQSFEFPLDFGIGSSCSLATVKDSWTSYVHIQVEMKEHYDLSLKIALGVVCGLIIISSIIAITVLIPCCHLHLIL